MILVGLVSDVIKKLDSNEARGLMYIVHMGSISNNQGVVNNFEQMVDMQVGDCEKYQTKGKHLFSKKLHCLFLIFVINVIL